MSGKQCEYTLSAEEQKKILKARAQALAKEPEIEEPGIGRIEVVEFLLAEERYGIEARYIRETLPLKELTALPCTPPFVVGIINLRGKILSVIDLKIFFDLPVKGLTDLNKVVVLHNGTMEFGILADAVPGTRLVRTKALQSNLSTLTDIRAEYLMGVTEDRLAVLDAEKILSDKKIIVHEEV